MIFQLYCFFLSFGWNSSIKKNKKKAPALVTYHPDVGKAFFKRSWFPRILNMSLLRFSWCDQCCEVMSLLNTLIQFTPWQLLSLLLFSRESCVQLFCDPMYCSLPGSSVHGISQVRILDWVAMPSSGDLEESMQGSNWRLLPGRWILYHWPTLEARYYSYL